MVDHYQRSRYELKYLVDEACARQVRDFIRSYLRRDPYARPDMRYAYPIYSLYLDSPDMTMFRAATQGQKNRYKLRVRYYDHKPDSPLFCEIKRRVGDVILKQRSVVRRDALERLLAGHCPCESYLHTAGDTESLDVMREFFRVCHALHAGPRMIIYYEREAWVAPDDDAVRITFDRAASAAHYDHTLEPKAYKAAKIDSVILELKFDDRFPLWMRDLAQSCNLYRTKMGKYVNCVEQIPRADLRPYPYVTAC